MRYWFCLNLVIATVMCLTTVSVDNSGIGNVITKVIQKYFSHLQCICVISDNVEGYLLADLKMLHFMTSFLFVVENGLNSFDSGSYIKPMLETTFQQARVG